MGYDSDIGKIFIKKKRSRSYKNTSRPPSPKVDSEGINLNNNYQGLNNVTGERLSVNESTKHQKSGKTSRYSSRTKNLPKLYKPANGDSRKLLSQEQIASSVNNLDDDKLKRRRCKEDKVSNRSHLTFDKELVTERQRNQEKKIDKDKMEDFAQIFSQLINKEPQTKKHTSVGCHQKPKTTANKRKNLAKKNIQYYENVADNESDTNTGSITSKCYYTDVIDLRNQSNENGEYIPQEISYYKPEPALTNEPRKSSGIMFEMRAKRLNDVIERRKYAGCKLALSCIPEIKTKILKSFKNQIYPGPVSEYTMNRGSLKCSVSGELKGLVEPILSKSEKIEKAIFWKPREEKEYQKELVPLQKYFKKSVDDQNLKQLSLKNKIICRSPKLERKASIITVASNPSIESMGFTELGRQPKLRPWTPEPKFKVWGYDSNGNELEDPPRPACLNYAFASSNNSADSGAKDVDPPAGLQNFYLSKSSGKTAEEILQIRKAENPYDLVIEDLEYAEDYLDNLNFNKHDPNEQNWRERVVRKRDRKTGFNEGSYHSKSVVEDELPKVLRYAWKGKYDKLQQYLWHKEKHFKANKVDKYDRSALHFAASWGHTGTIKLLTSVENINLDLRDYQGKTPLMKAVEVNSLDSVKRLCEAGCDIFVKSHDGFTAMEYALQRGDHRLGIIKYLYDFGDYKIQPRENGKMSLLHRVCVAKKDIPVASTLEYLISEGEEVKFTEGKGRTPLMLAVINNRMDLVKKLLASYADVTHIDLDFRNAALYANRDSEMYNLLIEETRRVKNSSTNQFYAKEGLGF